MTTRLSKQALQTLADIAKNHLRIDTLETRNSDSADFHEVAVWSIASALEAAYLIGAAEAQRAAAATPAPTLQPRAVEVETRRYRLSHMREPSGRGGWMFETHSGEILGNYNGTYAEAKRAAKADAAARGIALIYTCP